MGNIIKKVFFLLSAAIAFSAVYCEAVADPMDNVFGNTLRVAAGDGVTNYCINEDGTFTTDTGVDGTWALNGLEYCVTIAGETAAGLPKTGARRATYGKKTMAMAECARSA